jgi:hypothetical protein
MYMEKEFYGEKYDVQVGNDTYQLQSVELSDEKFFVVKQSGKVKCVLMQNNKKEWDADCELAGEVLTTLRELIKKLYNE